MNGALLAQLAHAKRNPEMAEEIAGFNHARDRAAKMLKAGKLTQREFSDFESHLYGKLLDALPADEFEAMMKDGRLADLETLARSHDGTRDSYGVEEDRKAVERKVKADALDEAWLEQRIDNKKFAELSGRHVETNEDLNNRMADGDYDAVAAEMFASRHDAPANHEGVLKGWLGKEYQAPKSQAPRSHPTGVVEHERTAQMPYSVSSGPRGGEQSSSDRGAGHSLDGIVELP